MHRAGRELRKDKNGTILIVTAVYSLLHVYFHLSLQLASMQGNIASGLSTYMASGELAAGPNTLGDHFHYHCLLSTQSMAWYIPDN